MAIIMDGVQIIEITVGPDTVHLIGDTVTIFAVHPMSDWTVREFCLPPIYFQDRKYYLKRKLPGPPPYAFRYELAPWHSDLGTESSRVITYDEAYVEQREHDLKIGVKHEFIRNALIPFYPLLGFCWSGFKQRVLGPLGFEPIAITSASILFCLAFFLLEAVFVLYFHLGFFGLIFGSVRWLHFDWFLFLLLPVDCIIRFDHVLRGDESPDGFLEWAWDWLKRRKAR